MGLHMLINAPPAEMFSKMQEIFSLLPSTMPMEAKTTLSQVVALFETCV